VVLGTLAGVLRLELFDRAMAIAAQLFTSVVPILIMLAAWVGPDTKDEAAQVLALPPEAAAVVEAAVDQSTDSAFGVLGALFVLVSATSLSRALTRAMASVWNLPRPRYRLSSAWRWVAVVLALVLSTVALRALTQLTEPLPPRNLWPAVVTFGLDVLLALSLPWLLLAREVPLRLLLPAALLFAVAMVAVRPATGLYLPRALAVSADRYGAMGVAFSYLAVMYIVAWVFLAAQILGAVVAEDEGWLGARIRGGLPVRLVSPPATAAGTVDLPVPGTALEPPGAPREGGSP
jgi:membrane protein